LNVTKKGILLHLLLGALVCFCACVPGKGREDQPYAWLTDSSKYRLLPPKDIEHPLDGYQMVSASYKGRDYSLNAWVKADAAGMNITIINELGANMGELSYHRGAASFSSAVFSLPLKPEYIVADFQLCFYNAPALREALQDCGLSLEDTGDSRRILQQKTVIIEIEKSRNAVKLINHLRGYAYTLEGDFE